MRKQTRCAGIGCGKIIQLSRKASASASAKLDAHFCLECLLRGTRSTVDDAKSWLHKRAKRPL